MTRELAWAPKCNCRTCRIRRMDSLSVGIRVPSIDCDGETWTRVNTGPRNDLFFPDALLSASRRVAGIRLEWWPPSNRNSGRDQIGIPGRLALEFAISCSGNFCADIRGPSF